MSNPYNGHQIYVPSTWSNTYPTRSHSGQIQLRKAKNGWIITRDGEEYVFVSLEEAVPFIKDEQKQDVTE